MSAPPASHAASETDSAPGAGCGAGHPYRRALEFTRGHRGPIAAIIGVTVAVGAINAVDPLILKLIVDSLMAGGGGAGVGLAIGVGGLLGVCLVREALNALSSWLTWRTRLRIQHGILDATVGRLHTLSVAFHRGRPVGALMARLDRGIQGTVAAFSELAFGLLPAVVFLAISTVAMLRLDGRLSLLLLSLLPLPTLVGIWAAPRQSRRDRTLLDRWSRIYARFNEVLSGIVTVKSFAMEHAEKQRFMTHVAEANGVVVTGVGFDARVEALQNLFMGATRVAVIGYGGYLVARHGITLGTLLAFLGYLSGLFMPVRGLTGLYQTLRRASVSLEAVFAILDARAEIGDAPGAAPLPAVRGDIEFDAVGFGYERGRPILHDISFRVAPGETVALVGPSGGGKTSLIGLLQRLYDPDRGRIRIDGADIRQVMQTSLRRQMGVVLQDALLFNESVRANIAYGRPTATEREIVEAARTANADEFIRRLPAGYETEVGERGGLLSAGQRQRIAIARALLKSPPIVVLDEATAALDAESEALIQEALARLLQGRTTLVVAHRLSTIVHADRILVLRGGRIVESGTHRELVAAGGYYASLVRLQTRGMILPEAA
jgi:ATP-binding cassette subfamily B protein